MSISKILSGLKGKYKLDINVEKKKMGEKCPTLCKNLKQPNECFYDTTVNGPYTTQNIKKWILA